MDDMYEPQKLASSIYKGDQRPRLQARHVQHVRSGAKVELPADILTVKDLQGMLAEHSDASPENRITVPPGTKIGGLEPGESLDRLGADIAKFDFSGADLRYVRLGRALFNPEAKFDSATIFADVIPEQSIKQLKRLHPGIELNIQPTPPVSPSSSHRSK